MSVHHRLTSREKPKKNIKRSRCSSSSFTDQFIDLPDKLKYWLWIISLLQSQSKSLSRDQFFMQQGTLWSKQRPPLPPSSRQLGPLPLHSNNKVYAANATLHRWCHCRALNTNQFARKRGDLIFQGIAAYLLFFLKQYRFSLVDSKYMRHRGRVPLPLLASAPLCENLGAPSLQTMSTDWLR